MTRWLAQEAALVWAASSLVVLGIVVPYLVAFRRRARLDLGRKQEAAQLGIDRPAAQYPFIDPARCIGCGACVSACPEGDVLGVVGGTATVINGLRCVGHARCEEACPVGAIEVGLGDLKARADVPLTDEWNESSLPGLFLVGEVAGLALVKNAIAQGRRAVERIAQRMGDGPRPAAAVDGAPLDLLIVGAGPAGLSAALSAVERGLSYRVLEQEGDLGGSILHYPRRKLVLIQPVEVPLHGRMQDEEYAKEAFLELMQSLVDRHRLEIAFGEKVRQVVKEGELFRAHSERGEHTARAVVLALGRRGTPRKLGAPGEELPKVMYRLLDAESYRGQRILVVGGGDSAVEAAIGLALQPGNDMSLSYRREKLVRIKKKNEERLATLLRQGRIRMLFSSQVEEIRPESVRLRVGNEAQELPNDYVFVFAGGEPPLELLKKAGVRFGGEPAPAGAVDELRSRAS